MKTCRWVGFASNASQTTSALARGLCKSSAAAIRSDAAQKKVTGGAWFSIWLAYLAADSERHREAARAAVKMGQTWIPVLAVLLFCQRTTAGAAEQKVVKEGQQAQIKCVPSQTGTMVVWFRLLDTSGMEFIASFSNSGVLKSSSGSFAATFSQSMIRNNILILQAFSRARHSGLYSCASLFNGNELRFGPVTRLVGEEEPAEEAPAATTKRSPCTTATPCVCSSAGGSWVPGETSPEMLCSSIILGPLAGGCGLLLLLLIVTVLYCNHVRTRRCPHHHKRKPQMTTPGKQMMTNRHV